MPTVTKKFVIQVTKENEQELQNLLSVCHTFLGWDDGFCFYNKPDISYVADRNFWIGIYYNSSVWGSKKKSGAVWEPKNNFFLRRSFKLVDINQLKKNILLIAKSEGKTLTNILFD